jgi:hypothetical protein
MKVGSGSGIRLHGYARSTLPWHLLVASLVPVLIEG